MNGKVIIGCDLNTDNLEADLKNAKKELQKYEKEAEKLTKTKAKIEMDLQPYEEAKQKLQQMRNEYKSLNEQALKIDTSTKEGIANYKEIGTQMARIFNDTGIYEAKLHEGNEEYKKLKQNLDEINIKIRNNTISQNIFNKKIQQITQKTKIVNEIENINRGLSKTINNVGKWALALFSVRSIYSLIINAMNTLSNYDPELANNIQYIIYAVATVLKPIVDFLVNAVYKLLSIIGAIVKLITGINLFSKATAKNFNNINSSAKSIKKYLAGWDEITKVDDEGLYGGLNNNIKQIKDLSIQVEEMSKKIKKWFLGGDTFGEGLKKGIEKWKKALEPIVNWIKIKFINPIINYFNEMKEILRPIWQPLKNALTDTISDIKIMLEPLSSFIKTKVLNPISNEFNLAKNNFLNRFSPFINKIISFINQVFGIFGVKLDYIDTKTQKTGTNIDKNINKSLEKTKKNADNLSNTTIDIKTKTTNVNTLGTTIKNLLDNLKNIVSKKWIFTLSSDTNALNNKLEPFRTKVKQLFGINLPKLAKGGIINQPGRGVPIGYGQAIGGENRAEGVIPLTDSQQMQLLGEAIGRYVTINANITNTMNGRVISRELQKVNNANDFAFNR